jgi:tRNA pseudouridine38-40 synthase
MQSWKLLLEYDGTRYSGWQKQLNARTVQGELFKASENAFGAARIEIGGAGRTDAGVHALGQVAHLKTNSREKFAAKQLQRAINDSLPPDINILRAQTAAPAFHARHDAAARYYLYQIAVRRTAFGKPFVWWVKDRLDAALMAEACRLLIGRGDFRSFTDDAPEQKSTVVEVDVAQIAVDGNLILFRIGASHFLWKMVRRITGCLVEIGRGRMTVRHFQNLLIKYSNEPAALTAPPSGLFLEKILYAGDQPPAPIQPAFPIS